MGGAADEHYRAMGVAAASAVATAIVLVVVCTNVAKASEVVGSIFSFLS